MIDFRNILKLDNIESLLCNYKYKSYIKQKNWGCFLAIIWEALQFKH